MQCLVAFVLRLDCHIEPWKVWLNLCTISYPRSCICSRVLNTSHQFRSEAQPRIETNDEFRSTHNLINLFMCLMAKRFGEALSEEEASKITQYKTQWGIRIFIYLNIIILMRMSFPQERIHSSRGLTRYKLKNRLSSTHGF